MSVILGLTARGVAILNCADGRMGPALSSGGWQAAFYKTDVTRLVSRRTVTEP